MFRLTAFRQVGRFLPRLWLGGLPWVLRERQVIPPEVERGLRLLEEPQRRSVARRYVG